MTSVESYKHKFACAQLAAWLREAYLESNRYGIDIYPIAARPNRGPPLYGVVPEYPICLNDANEIVGLCPIWDETWWSDTANLDWRPEPPTYEWCIAHGLLPFVIFDLAVLHKGSIAYGLEVVHRNSVSDNKRQKLLRVVQETYGFLEVYTIDADWILNQVKRPKQLQFDLVFSDDDAVVR